MITRELKIGDKVRVKSIEWYNENKDENGNIYFQGVPFNKYMALLCGKEVIIREISDSYYLIDEPSLRVWTDEMFEDGVIEEPNDIEKTLTKQGDSVNHPSHYTWLKDLCGVEVIDITRHMDFNLGNAIKYILRCGHKSEQGMTDKEKTIEDLKKAEFYIKDKIKMLEKVK